MEVFMWFIANPDGSHFEGRGNNFAELPQFLVDVDDFVGPLFRMLQGLPRDGEKTSIFDKVVFADPRLKDASPWNGEYLKEIKRIDPRLIQLLAKVTPRKCRDIAEEWYWAANVRQHYLDHQYNADDNERAAREELLEILASLIKLSKRSIKLENDVMETFWWATA